MIRSQKVAAEQKTGFFVKVKDGGKFTAKILSRILRIKI